MNEDIQVKSLNKDIVKQLKELNDLYKSGVADLSIVDEDDDFDYEEFDKKDAAEDTMGLLSKYIDNYEIDIDKTKLKGIMNDLYVTALRGD